MARRPQVLVQASPISDRLNAPATNPALQLASALADIEPAAAAFTQQRAADLTREANIRAKSDAIKSSGAAFADAVRDGKIERTQNPFYMDAYRRESAQVRGNQALAEVVTQSQTWEERNDPAAFQERLNREVGAVGETVAGGDQEAQLGFLAAANPVLQQQIASNTAQNVQRITQEREANAGTLAAQTISDTNKANGGNASPAQVRDALLEQKEGYLATGGSEGDWNKVVIQAVTTAAYNAGDTDIIDTLKSEELGKLYDLPGVAENLESTQYRIRQGVIDRLTFAETAARAEDQAKGREFMAKLYERYDDELLLGELPVQEMIDYGQAEGYSMGAIASALSQTNSQVQQTQSLQNARFNAIGLDPARGRAVMRLFADVARNPTAPGLSARIDEGYLSGDISPDDATRLLTQIGNAEGAAGAGGASGAGSGSGGGGSSESVGRTTSGVARVRSLTALNQRIEQLAYGAAARTGSMSESRRTAAEQAARNAAMVYLASHPGDYQGAATAASAGAVRWAQRASSAPSTPAASTANRREPGQNSRR